MNDLILSQPKDDTFIFSARDILVKAGIDKKNIARTMTRNIVNNEILELNTDYIETTVSEGKGSIIDYMLTKKAMEFVLISLRTAKANQLRKSLIEKMQETSALMNPRQAINDGLKLAYALIAADKARQEKEKQAELLVLEAKGKRIREEVITKINELARKIGMEQNNGNVRAVYARLYRCFARVNKRWYWGNAMQAKNHLEYIGEMGGVSDLRLLHEILISFIDEASTFYAEDEYDSKGEKRNGN